MGTTDGDSTTRGADGPEERRGGSPAATGVPRARLVAGVLVVPLALLALALALPVALHDRLPNPMATHWAADGHANGAMTPLANVVFLGVLGLVLWATGAFAVVAGRGAAVRFRSERIAMVWCTAVAAFMAGLSAIIVAANLDAATWSDAEAPLVTVLIPLVAGVLGGVLGWHLAGPAPPPPPRPAGLPAPLTDAPLAVPHVDLAVGEEPVWGGHQHSALLTAVTVGLVVVGLGFVPVVPPLGVVLVVVAVATGILSSVDVVVDRTGLTVRLGPFGWPAKRVAIGDVGRVEATDLEPLEWGGWGYRVLPGRSAVVMRRGPGIVVEQRDGRRFAVTVEDAVTGAALLEAYRRRSAERGDATGDAPG